MAKSKYLDLTGLSKFKDKIVSLIASHTSDNNIHTSKEEKGEISTAYSHSTSVHAPTDAEKNIIVGVQKNGSDLSVNNSTRKVNITVPTKVSDLTNDSGYLTEHQDISGKLDKNQGVSNSGKIAGINESGDIVPMFPQGVTYNEDTQCLEYGADEKLNLNVGIQLDDTLSKVGYAADASKVGELKSDLIQLEDYLIDYEDMEISTKDNYYVSADETNKGQLVANGGSYYADFSVSEGDVYVLETDISNPVRSAYALYDANMNCIKAEPAPTDAIRSSYRIEIPKGCYFMRIGRNGNTSTMKLTRYSLANYNDNVFGKQADSVNGYASASDTNIFFTPMPNDGLITKIEINCSTAGQVDVYKFKRITGSQFVTHTGFVGSYNVVEGYNAIDCVAYVNKDEYLGFFGVGTVGIGYCNSLPTESYLYISSYGSARDNQFTVVSDKYLACRFTFKAKDLFEKETQNKNGGCLIDTEVVTNENIVRNEGWSAPFSTSTVNAYVSYKNPSGMDEYIGHIKFTTTDVTSKFALCQFDDGGYYVSVDFGNDIIKIHHTWDGNITSGETYVLDSATISDKVDIVANRQYVVEVEQDSVKTLTVTLTDAQTMKSVSLSHICVKDENSADYNNHGKGRHPFAVILRNGDIAILNFKIYTKMPTRPLLMIYGDSFCEGFNLIRYGFECEQRYPQLIKNALNGNVAISAKGGESTTRLVEKLETDLTLFKPKYTLIAMSINDSIVSQNSLAIFKTNMTKLIEKTRENGSEPILVTLPSMGNGAELIRQYNSWIKNYYLDLRYLDINKVLSVTTSDTPDTSLFLDDGHPNVEGNERIFNKFMLDFSDIIADIN